MRVFAAVELPGDLRGRIAAATRELLAERSSARLVAEENLHVTVRFLGELAQGDVDRVLVAAAEAAAAVETSRAELRGFGVFPSLRRPHILWTGIDDRAGSLGRLEGELSRRIAALGIPPDQHAFTPHVTVARLRDERGWSNRRKSASMLRLDETSPRFGETPVERLTVFSSELLPHGARYTALARFPLQPHLSSKEQQR